MLRMDACFKLNHTIGNMMCTNILNINSFNLILVEKVVWLHHKMKYDDPKINSHCLEIPFTQI